MPTPRTLATTLPSSSHDKQDLFGLTEAGRIHGPVVPLVTYQSMYEGLFVYASPFAEGTPYISPGTI